MTVATRDSLLARIRELEEENSDLAETLERINELSSDAVDSGDSETDDEGDD
jgi:hypothetical protein